MIRVLVAEDSVTVRELLIEILESSQEIEVVGQAKDGIEAIELTERLRPDIVTMDVHMPLLDGFEATKEIMARVPTPIVIVSSSINERDVEMALNATRAGALMVIAKPDNPKSPHFSARQGQLVTMVKALSQVKVVRRWGGGRNGSRPSGGVPTPQPRRMAGTRARIVAIAASTGGPAALQRILPDLPGDFPAPILVVQHIAPGFVSGLADWLNANCALRVKVAEHGEPALRRSVFLAPDERHLGVSADGRVCVVDDPPLGGFRPSGTYLFESAARAYGSAVAAVILTGMGSDGVAGLRAVKAAGGHVLAQDEESSVVYGMPREALAAGVVDAVSSLSGMPRWLAELTAGGP